MLAQSAFRACRQQARTGASLGFLDTPHSRYGIMQFEALSMRHRIETGFVPEPIARLPGFKTVVVARRSPTGEEHGPMQRSARDRAK